MSNHVKIVARCDFSQWLRQRHNTYLPWHPLLALGSSSAITIGHEEVVLHIVSFRQSHESSSLVLYNHWEHHWKWGTRVLAACKIVTANQSKPEGRSHPRTAKATAFDNRVDVSDIWMLLWLYPSVLRRVGAPMLSSKRVMCLRLSLTSYIIWQNAFYDESYTLSVNN
jgi:hypothetical protein